MCEKIVCLQQIYTELIKIFTFYIENVIGKRSMWSYDCNHELLMFAE